MRGFKHRLRPLEEAVHGLRRDSVTDRRVGPPAVAVGLDELDDGVPRLVPRRPFPVLSSVTDIVPASMREVPESVSEKRIQVSREPSLLFGHIGRRAF